LPGFNTAYLGIYTSFVISKIGIKTEVDATEGPTMKKPLYVEINREQTSAY
jgi:hypothetical protein